MFGKFFIAGYHDPNASRLSVYTLSKKAPSDGSRDDDVRDNGRWKITCETPGILGPEKTLLATTIAGNFNKKRYISRNRDISVGMWQPPQKRVQNRMVEELSHNAWSIGGEAYLLMCQRSVSSRALSNQTSEVVSPAHETPIAAGAKGSSDS